MFPSADIKFPFVNLKIVFLSFIRDIIEQIIMGFDYRRNGISTFLTIESNE